MPVRPCSGLSSRGTKSSGLVQITAAASLASTVMIVLDVPSRDLPEGQSQGPLRRPAGLGCLSGRWHEHSVFAGVTQVDRLSRLRHAVGRSVDLWHAGNQFLVVLAIPRFVEVELVDRAATARYRAEYTHANSAAACHPCRRYRRAETP